MCGKLSNDIKHVVVLFCLIGFIKWCHPKMVSPGAGRPPLATPLRLNELNC